MAKILQVPFQGGVVLFEAPDEGEARGFAASDVLEHAEDTLEDAVATMRRVGDAFVAQLSKLAYDSAEVTLGIKVSGKGKFIVAEASAEAALTVKLAFKGAKG